MRSAQPALLEGESQPAAEAIAISENASIVIGRHYAAGEGSSQRE